MGGIEKFSVDEFDHFVVYRGTDGRYVYMADPIRGNLRVPTTVFCQAVAEKRHLAIAKPGHKVKTHSPLSIRGEELFLGELNDQLIRRAAHRDIAHPVQRAAQSNLP